MRRADPTAVGVGAVTLGEEMISSTPPSALPAEVIGREAITTPIPPITGIPTLEPTIGAVSTLPGILDEVGAADLIEAPEEIVVPSIPRPTLLRRQVYGRYRGTLGSWQLEVRPDVDGPRPAQRISGDLYQTAGATVSYFGSFIAEVTKLTITQTVVVAEGTGAFTWNAGAPVVRITIPRNTILAPPAPATVQFFTASGAPGATYICPFESAYFRTVQYEQDRVSDVTTPAFTSYGTGSLPSGGPARNLTVAQAYAEAGIEMQSRGIWDVVPMSEEGADAKWTDRELHDSMLRHFSLWREQPQWKVWLLVAQEHVLGPGLLGIMFDQIGLQRQGCAVFHKGLGGTTPEKLREQLFCYVHELGHCFNLLHSWQKHFATPPTPDRPNALSWMNYPWNYPGGGAPAFWNQFPFQFDDLEIAHLRHGYRNNVVMGGNPFGIGAGLEDPQAFADPIIDNSGLLFKLEARKSYLLGEPVVAEAKLYTTDLRGKAIHPYLHPRQGFVQYAIRKPGGQVLTYKPILDHCVDVQETLLDQERPSIYESVYIGYGKDGFYFDQPGTYQIRAMCHALDGSQIVSNILTLRVRHPLSVEDEEVAEPFMGNDQGVLFYLLGSDSTYLRSGNEALDLVLERHGKHPLATYARLVKGLNAGRVFKSITASKGMEVRKAQHEASIGLLSPVADATIAGKGIDNITLNMVMHQLIRANKGMGETAHAEAIKNRVIEHFARTIRRPHVMGEIRARAEQVLNE